jgi:hypothetical protein
MNSRNRLLVTTQELAILDAAGIQELKANGIGWVRPYVRPWVKTLRDPIMGSILELMIEERRGCIPIDSAEASRLIRQLASAA